MRSMTRREQLHQIVDRLPEEEITLAIRLLQAVEETEHGEEAYTIENAPLDDEAFDPADIEGLENERLIPHEDVIRRLQR